jgi:hypothetical protein
MNIRIAAVLSSLVLAAAPAQAVITSITLSGGTAQSPHGGVGVIIATPTDVTKATLNSINDVVGFNEVTNVTLVAPQPNGFRFATLDNGNINPGLAVSSHFFVFAPNAGRTVTGTISFNQNVIAVQRTIGQFSSAGTNQLQTGLTNFAAQFDLENADLITRTGAKTVSFSLSATNGNSDMFRIITSVPETSTWIMLIAGFGLVGAAGRRRHTVVAA